MNTKPKRRWYQFSLRTMLIVMVVSSAVFGWWVHWSREWIRHRQEFVERLGGIRIIMTDSPTRAPGGLWLFGEYGVTSLGFEKPLHGDDLERAKRLYPETIP